MLAVPLKRKQAERDSDESNGSTSTTVTVVKKRARVCDLEECLREYVIYSYKYFRSALGCRDAFPDAAKVNDFFADAWWQACQHFGEDIVPTPTIKKLVSVL